MPDDKTSGFMKNDEDLLNKFKVDFKNDYGLSLTNDQAKEAAGNLVNFFNLLSRFDQEDQQKKIKTNQN